MTSLQGKVAVVTGSTSGIGLGVASALGKAGCKVMINGLGDDDQIQSALDEVRASGAVANYHGADMRDPGQIADLIQEAGETFGTVDILVNNAGIQFVSPVQDFPIEKWDQIIAINLSSAFHTIRAAIPGMLETGWGRVINIASAHALAASPFKSAYVAAKHGTAGLTKTVALEVAEQGITVNAIAPGYVKTPLVTGQIKATAKARGISEEEVVRDVMLHAQPTRQFVTIEQVATMALYLCSEGASAITGTVMSIDGGWTAK